jgi:hypothetical protein
MYNICTTFRARTTQSSPKTQSIGWFLSLRNKYRASFYMGNYKDTKRRFDWTSFCVRIKAFCESVGLQTLSNNLEENLWNLRHNLTIIMMDRKWKSQLERNIFQEHDTRRHMKKLVEVVQSGATYNVQRAKETDQMIEDVNVRIDALRQEQQDTNAEVFVEMKRLNTVNKGNVRALDSSIRQNEKTSKKLIESLQTGYKKPHVDSVYSLTPEEGCITAEALVLCRWLL